MYRSRYGHLYVSERRDIRNHPIFQYTLSELRMRLLNRTDCMNIITKMYPKFPKGFGKKDSVFLFFDRLLKDNRVNDLRYYLLNN